MRDKFFSELKDLNVELLKMGAMVQDIIQVSVKALATQDLNMAKKVKELDDCIDKLEMQIEVLEADQSKLQNLFSARISLEKILEGIRYYSGEIARENPLKMILPGCFVSNLLPVFVNQFR